MTDFPDPSKPGTYPGILTPPFTIQDEIFDDNLVPPLTEEQVAQAREWNQLLANFVDLYEDIRLAIVALNLDPDLGDDLEASFTLLTNERANLILSSVIGFAGDPNTGGPPSEIDNAIAGTLYIDQTNIIIWQRLSDAGSWVQIFPQGSAGLQTVSLGGTPELDAISRIFKVIVSEADFTAAAAEESITLFQLPPGAIIQTVMVKHSTAFSGGALSAYTLGVGIAALKQKYLTDFDVFSAPSSTNDKVATSGDKESHDAETPILLTAKSTGGDVADATAGDVEVWVVAISTLSSGALITASGLELQKEGVTVAGGPFKILNLVGFLDVSKVSDGLAKLEVTGGPYTTRVDPQGLLTYFGKALLGSLTSDPVWRIALLDDSGPELVVLFADGDKDFDNVWDDHLTLSYS